MPPQAAARPRAGRRGQRDIAGIALISLHIRAKPPNPAYRRVYPVLTMFRKDCGHISQKRRQRVHILASADSKKRF
jgi:hypothetical protein